MLKRDSASGASIGSREMPSAGAAAQASSVVAVTTRWLPGRAMACDGAAVNTYVGLSWQNRMDGACKLPESCEETLMAKKVQAAPTLADKRTTAQRKDRAQYGAKRQSILRAAGPVLQRNGLGGTTIEAIAKEAGVDRATIYYYFEDKHAIFHEAIHGGLVEMVAALEDVAATGAAPEIRLRESIHVVMRSYEMHYPQLYLFFKDGPTSAVIDNDLYKEILASGRRYEDLVEATVRDGIYAGVISVSLPPKVFAKLVVGMLNWTAWWFVPGGALTADDVAEGMADVVLNGALVHQPMPRRDRAERSMSSGSAGDRPVAAKSSRPKGLPRAGARTTSTRRQGAS